MCKLLKVSRSSYYKSQNPVESKRSIENKRLKEEILKIYNEYVNRIQSYGALRVKRESGSKPLQPPLL